jgi:hypothetical protein
LAGAIAVIILLGFLGWAGWYGVHAWGTMGDVRLSTAGWVFLCMAVVFTSGLGAGLMALVFYSSRHDMDR